MWGLRPCARKERKKDGWLTVKCETEFSSGAWRVLNVEVEDDAKHSEPSG